VEIMLLPSMNMLLFHYIRVHVTSLVNNKSRKFKKKNITSPEQTADLLSCKPRFGAARSKETQQLAISPPEPAREDQKKKKVQK
jgi:hypothetical protein